VVISLFGLFLIGQAYMIGVATACIVAVLLVLLAALTLLPALLGFAGEAIDKLHLPACCRAAGLRRRTDFGSGGAGSFKGGHGSQGRWPPSSWSSWRFHSFSIRLAFTDAGNDPASLTTRQAYDLLPRDRGGVQRPLVVAVAMPGPTATSTVGHLRAAIAGTARGGRRGAAPVQRLEERSGARGIPDDVTASCGDAIPRAHVANGRDPQVVGGTRVDAQVGGETAVSIDAATFLEAGCCSSSAPCWSFPSSSSWPCSVRWSCRSRRSS